MARLNEPPQPTESVDGLKRRFIRQNRDLAKTNSTQCLRIRTLECDVSRLLAENLNLREENLRLQNELSTAQSHASLQSVKDRLDEKLSEFASLISEIGSLPGRDSSRRHSRDPSSWRPPVPVAALSGQSHRMSEILEEKASPGGSLHAENVRVMRLSDQTNESPDLGPPPVAHFDCDDPIKFHLRPEKSTAGHPEDANDTDAIPASLSVNLETRRRRKDSHSKSEPRPNATLFQAEHEQDVPSGRIGAKRKLSMRDAEDDNAATAKDDFVFSRRSSAATDVRKNLGGDETAAETAEPADKPAMEPLANPPRMERKVLGDKSVNLSPKKVSRDQGVKDNVKKPAKPTKDPGSRTSRERRPRLSSVRLAPAAETIITTVELPPPDSEPSTSLPPKTPAADLFSPTPSEQSATRSDGRDTPPPSALVAGSTSSSALNAASRPSRRARAAVNYAEPNLVSKMRRPGKELVAAVALPGGRSGSNPPPSEDSKSMRTVFIKSEEGADSEWKGLPVANSVDHLEQASPLRNKSGTFPDGGAEEVVKQDPIQASASGRAIAALMAGSSRAKERDGGIEIEAKLDKLVGRTEGMDLYDLIASSSPPTDLNDSTKQATVTSNRVNHTRRHSTIVAPESLALSKRRGASRSQAQGSEATSEDMESRGGRVASRRRSMML